MIYLWEKPIPLCNAMGKTYVQVSIVMTFYNIYRQNLLLDRLILTAIVGTAIGMCIAHRL